MYNANIPADHELPSGKRLLITTLLAGLTAGALLVTVVLPAEYGKDPTGIGEVLGLTKMGEIKISLQQEAAEDEAAFNNQSQATAAAVQPVVATYTPTADQTPTLSRDEVRVSIDPNETAELKVDLRKGTTVDYQWQSDSRIVHYDIHGDSVPLNIRYHNYEKGRKRRGQGTITAAFDGKHGWYWKNRSSETVTITLQTTGQYTKMERVD